MRRNEIKKSLCTAIQFMHSTILAGMKGIITTALVENGEEKGAMVESTILDRVIQFRNLKGLVSDKNR